MFGFRVELSFEADFHEQIDKTGLRQEKRGRVDAVVLVLNAVTA